MTESKKFVINNATEAYAAGYFFNGNPEKCNELLLYYLNLEEQEDLSKFNKELVNFPVETFLNENLSTDRMQLEFIRGLFDRSGEFYGTEMVGCNFSCSSVKALELISKFINVKNTVNLNNIYFYHTNAIDFLSKIYDNIPNECPTLLRYGYERYLKLLDQKNVPHCKFTKTTKEAVSPFKANASDEGYDLWLIGIDKKVSDVTTRYETGIKVQPPLGYHVEILPRSSLSNSGYMLANSVGLIDASYTGTLKVALTKVDPNAQDLTLPFKAVQMVLRKSQHFLCEEVEEIEETARSSGGFGSTG